MNIGIVIPAHNEEKHIASTLDSLLNQTYQAGKIIVVNDNSTDSTEDIVKSYSKDRIELITKTSCDQNVPGSKVVEAFNTGLRRLDLNEIDIICKYDADLIFPAHYLQSIVNRFENNKKLGMVAGHCTVLKDETWLIENLNNPDHIRGALKAYRTDCFKEIGGLRSSMGWDTIDEMLARYYDWEVETIPDLLVKHLKPTGSAYENQSYEKQGEVTYKMRLGLVLTLFTAVKMAMKKNRPSILREFLNGYRKSKQNNVEQLVTESQGKFIRNYRWKGIRKKTGPYTTY